MTERLVINSAGVADTAALAAALADRTAGGDLLVLTGDLGAGKTAFTKAYAAALGVTALVTSPTFTMANRYEGRLIVNHLDAYRLDGLRDVHDLGLDELITDDAVTVIEWGDTIAPVLPGDRLEVALTIPADADRADDDRVITVSALGDSWRARLDGLQVASW